MNTWYKYNIIYPVWVHNIYGSLQSTTIGHNKEINCTQMREYFVIFILATCIVKVGG